ncbi:MAG: histidine ammonia-lyase [Bacteroidales bacterium]|jgi:histidine ammonia-lyase|nr:histidine ammonia-lyase [Bacteroidales bacterium]
MRNNYTINSERLTFYHIQQALDNECILELSEDSKKRIQKCRDYLDKKMETQIEPIYGITTGFGPLCAISIDRENLSRLQENLVMSHACGIGEEVPQPIVRLMLFLKVQSLSYGHSGVQLITVQRLLDFFNHDILPVVYQQGSLGASGDLAPLAHLSLPLLGKGEVYYKGEKRDSSEVLKEFGWEPIKLQSKEGLALLNGTQFMSAFGVYTLLKTFRLQVLADMIGAVSLDSFDGRIEPFYDKLHEARHHKGQQKVARHFRKLLKGSELISGYKEHVQDPYSFRCIPQVHGASSDAIDYVAQAFSNEINAVTDNPTIFPDEDVIISGGNFHGQPLAIALDTLGIALAELANISERRIYQLISGKRGLPNFLVTNPGLNSGFMIPQYTAASIVSQNKQLATPASIDSIESSQGQEDHVSMGANGATKAWRIVQNTERVLAIELMNAAQALEYRRPKKSSPVLEEFVAQFRKHVPNIAADTLMYPEMNKAVKFLQTVKIDVPEFS